jgi:hypothetical protein
LIVIRDFIHCTTFPVLQCKQLCMEIGIHICLTEKYSHVLKFLFLFHIYCVISYILVICQNGHVPPPPPVNKPVMLANSTLFSSTFQGKFHEILTSIFFIWNTYTTLLYTAAYSLFCICFTSIYERIVLGTFGHWKHVIKL